MAHCSVPSCSNNWHFKEKYAAAHKKKLSFHEFPQNKVTRKRWVTMIRRDEGPNFEITNRTYVCSAHFTDDDFKFTLTGMRRLKQGAVPSLFSWTQPSKQRKPPKQRISEAEQHCGSDTLNDCAAGSSESASVSPVDYHDYHCPPSSTEEQLRAAQKHIEELQAQVTKHKLEQFGLQRFSNDSDMIKFYTGFPNYDTLKSFFDGISPNAAKMIKWTQHQRLQSQRSKKTYQSFSNKLILIDQFFMFLHKIRLGSLDQDLADKFCVSQSTVSRNTVSWTNFLYCILGAQPLWPTKDQIEQHMPQSFQTHFPGVRVILDCTELKVQSPSSLILNSEMYSHYKGTTTLKGLVGITPAGAVSFVSTLYSGSISDKHITRVSGILGLLEAGDEVMADKGFLIEDMLAEKGCKLVIPHFLADKGQFKSTENSENQLIANLRVHVERAICRFREYHIFDSVLPLNLAGTVNQLWAVCCLLTNFQGPLIKEK